MLRRYNCRDSVSIHLAEGGQWGLALAEFFAEGDNADLHWAPKDSGVVLWSRPGQAPQVSLYSVQGELLSLLDQKLLTARSICSAALSSAAPAPRHVASVTGANTVAAGVGELLALGLHDLPEARLVSVVDKQIRHLCSLPHDLGFHAEAVREDGTGLQVYVEELIGGGCVPKQVHRCGGLNPERAGPPGRRQGVVRYVVLETPSKLPPPLKQLLALRQPNEPTSALPRGAGVEGAEGGGEPQTAVGAEKPRRTVSSMAWSPDDRYLATKMEQAPTVLWIWDTGRLAPKALLVHRAPIRSFVWSDSCQAGASRQPGGSSARLAIATADWGPIFLWSPDGATVAHCDIAKVGPTSASCRLEWTRDGEKLLLQDTDMGCVCYLRTSGGRSNEGPMPMEEEGF